MGCFYLLKLKVKLKKWKQVKSTTTSRSDDSGVPKQSSKSSGSASSHQSISSLYEEKGHNLRVFRYRELRDATNDFSRLQKIGEGGFGSVYKGFVKPPSGKGDNITVAVKKLNPNSLQGHKQWLAEVHFLGVVEHPNLVKLIGYCAIDGERGVQRLLVYEFMQNKSLEDHLFGRVYPSLPWNLRLQIALGAAEGLTYLHEGLEVQIIYRDFKASNVLLDEEFHPKLSDFGLAREGPSAGDTHVSTAVMGTYGYAAPDYIETGHLTEKSDVWSFGVVLYEILTGRKSMERNRPRNEQKLLDWVKRYPVDRKRFSTVMDPRLKNNYSMRAAKEIAKLANTCLSRNARDRPKMWEVAEGIKRAMEYKEMDGGDEICASESENEKQVEEEEEEEEETGGGESESTRRRMLHLAKLRETANVLGIGRKRPLFMKFAEPM